MEKNGTRITAAYCEEFHKVAWEQACKVNPENPLAAAESIGDLLEALTEAQTFTKQDDRVYFKVTQALSKARRVNKW